MRVQQILINLLSNAIKFSFPGQEVRVALSCQQDSFEDNKLNVKISVIDTGVGILESDLQKLF